MPAGSFTSAPAAERSCDRNRAIAACSALTARCPVRRFRPSIRAGRAQLPAAQDKHDGERYSTGLTRLVGQHAHQLDRVVDSSGRHSCRFVRLDAYSSRHLDHRSDLDGHGVHSECKTVRSHALPLHGTFLSRHDRTGARAWLGHRIRRNLWMDCVGRPHYRRRQSHLVGDRAGVGKVLVDAGTGSSKHASSLGSDLDRVCPGNRRFAGAITAALCRT